MTRLFTTFATPADVLVPADMRSLSLASLVSLALARGTAASVFSTTRALLSHVEAGADGSAFPIPASLQAFCKIAKGTSGKALIRPTAASLVNAEAVAADAARIIGGDVAAIASDGTHLFVASHGGAKLTKIGSGYNGTEAGRLYASRDGAPAGPHVAVLHVGGRVLVRHAGMKPGDFAAFFAGDLTDAGIVSQVCESAPRPLPPPSRAFIAAAPAMVSRVTHALPAAGAAIRGRRGTQGRRWPHWRRSVRYILHRGRKHWGEGHPHEARRARVSRACATGAGAGSTQARGARS